MATDKNRAGWPWQAQRVRLGAARHLGALTQEDFPSPVNFSRSIAPSTDNVNRLPTGVVLPLVARAHLRGRVAGVTSSIPQTWQYVAWAVAIVVLVVALAVVFWLWWRRRSQGEGDQCCGDANGTKLRLSSTQSCKNPSPRLCPGLIVPDGCEALYALKENTFSNLPRAMSAIKDNMGREVAIVEGTCISSEDRMCLRRSKENKEILAEVRREKHGENKFRISTGHGGLFGVLESDTVDPLWWLTVASGSRLLTFHGDLLKREFSVENSQHNETVAQVGGSQAFFEFDQPAHYQVRVASGIDAGIILLCCLVIEEAQ